ncbi:MAG: permease prefix domain 1-containing protein [Verrucomicrobiota bacterium]
MKPFELENAIASWRAQWVASEGVSRETVAELEEHLREQVDGLRTSGLPEEEAFLLARRRLGDSGALDEEFCQVAPGIAWRRRLFWMVVGYLGISVLLMLAHSIAYGSAVAGLFRLGSTYQLSVDSFWFVGCQLLALLVVGGLGYGAFRLVRNGKILAIAVFSLFVLLRAGDHLKGILVAQRLSTTEYGLLAFHSSLAGTVVQVVLLVVLLAGLIWCGRSVRNPA